MTTELPSWVRAGVSFRDETGPRDRHRVWHVRAVVDDRAVMRSWDMRFGGSWRYECESWAFFEVRRETLRILSEEKSQ